MNQFEHIKILEELMLHYADEEIKLNYSFNKILTKTNKINVMEWPASSLDLNPIENVWSNVQSSLAKQRNAEKLLNVV